MMFQSYALYLHMSVRENIVFLLKLWKYPPEEVRRRVDQAAGILGITEYLDRKPRALSGGQGINTSSSAGSVPRDRPERKVSKTPVPRV